MTLQIGDTAPDFEAETTEGRVHPGRRRPELPLRITDER